MKLIELAILGAFDVIFYIMISGKIANQYKESKKLYIILIILVSILIGIVGVSPLREYNVLISSILTLLLTFILCKKKFKEILYTYILTTIIILLIQYMVLFTFQTIGMNISYSFRVGFIAQSMGLIITILITKYLPIDILLNYTDRSNRVFIYSLYKRRSKSNLDELPSDKFYILGRDAEENADINSVKGLIIKINNYFNSISPIKYFGISLSAIIIIEIIMTINYSTYISKSVLLGIKTWSFSKITIYILIETISNVLLYIFLLSILKFTSKDKSIKLNHILIVSIILSIFIKKDYLNSGILIYSVNVFLGFIYNFIYSYTYGLFYYKKKKPLIIISTISIIENIIMILGIIAFFKS